MQKIFYESPEEFLTDPRFRKSQKVGGISFKISRFGLQAIVLSLVIHLVLLFLHIPKQEQTQTGRVSTSPFKVTIVSPQEAKPPAEVVLPPEPTPVVPKSKPNKRSKPKVKEVLTAKPKPIEKPPTFTVPKELAKIEPPPVEQTLDALDLKPRTSPPADNEPTDMMAYVNKKRQARVASGDPAAINAAEIAKAQGPSLEEQRMERIKENMKSGTNGIFEITRLGRYEASFAFKGWTGDYSAAKMQYFVVEATPSEDVRLNMIRRMIALIRTHYQEDFTWQSQRLHQSVTLSARLADSAGLEDFLMREFFGEHYAAQ